SNRQSNEYYEFDKLLLFGDAYVPWKEFDHPQFGKIEIGGAKKNYTRNHPGFLLLEDAHRNAAFTIYHGYHTPKLEFNDIEVKSLGNNLFEVKASVWNSRIIPTHSDHDVRNKINRPNYISISGVEVIAGMRIINNDFNVTEDQKFKSDRIVIPGIDRMYEVKVKWSVKGKPNKAKITVDREKGGVIEKEVIS